MMVFKKMFKNIFKDKKQEQKIEAIKGTEVKIIIKRRIGERIPSTVAVFEATHGTAPKYAGKDMVNPGSLILSGALMFEYIGWSEVAELIRVSLEKTIKDKVVTYDLARQMPGAKKVKCSEFGEAIVDHM